MGIKRASPDTDEFFHMSTCGGKVIMAAWLPRGVDATAESTARRGVCDRCSVAFFDPGGLDVSDDDLQAGEPA